MKDILRIGRILTAAVFLGLTIVACGGSSESTLGAGEGGLSAASSVSAVSATE